MIILHNASIHRTPEVEQACASAGVKLVYLSPYAPDKNPIEEAFAKMKAFAKRHWYVYEENPDLSSEGLLKWCVDEVGSRKSSASGHFRHAGMTIEEEED